MPRRTRLASQRTQLPPQPVTTITPDPLAWRTALRLAKGDRHRLRPLPDGAVLVLHRQ